MAEEEAIKKTEENKNEEPKSVQTDSRFPFVNEDNLYQVSGVLKQLIKNKPENLKYACLVISTIRSDFAEKILAEFTLDMQAGIMNEMLSLIQLSKSEVDNFEKNLPNLIQEQFGGRFVLSKIIENLKVEEKIKLTDTIKQRYPNNLYAFRQIVILFEDLFKYDDESFARLFSEVSSDILASAFARESEENTKRLMNCLPKGVKAMVEQGIEASKLRSSASEISKSQQHIIDRAKQLVDDGFLSPLVKKEDAG